MTNVNVIYKNKEIDEIIIKGHTGYACHGHDIVCASVSSITICTVNFLLKYDGNCIRYEENEGFLRICVKKYDNVISIALSNMLDLLKELMNQYKKNIKIVEEV